MPKRQEYAKRPAVNLPKRTGKGAPRDSTETMGRPGLKVEVPPTRMEPAVPEAPVKKDPSKIKLGPRGEKIRKKIKFLTSKNAI